MWELKDNFENKKDNRMAELNIYSLTERNWILDSLIAEILSQNIGVGSCWWKLSFPSSLLNQKTWYAQDVVATNSASVVDNVTIGYFFEDQNITVDPNVRTCLDVLFLSSKYPT